MVNVLLLENDETLDEATLLALAGISHRNLTRWRQQGLVLPVEPRRGLGPPFGSTPLRYPTAEVAKIGRLLELRQQFKRVFDWRWVLWLENHRVRVAPDLAGALKRFEDSTSRIRTLHDIETRILDYIPDPVDLPRGDPLRLIFHGLARHDRRSLMTMILCILLGVRLPLLDERNPAPFRVFKRAFGFPDDWELPPDLFDVFPRAHRQVLDALSSATADELEAAKATCRLLSCLLDQPEDSSGGATAADSSDPQHRRAVNLFGSFWRAPAVRAGIAGFVILGMRRFKSDLRAQCMAALASYAGEIGAVHSESTAEAPVT
jgi:hypothetical protein